MTKSLRLWDAASGALVREFNASDAASSATWWWEGAFGALFGGYKSPPGPVNSVAFSPDGQHLLSGDSDNLLRLWDAASGRLIREFKGPRNDTLHFANFADGIREGKKLNSEIEDGQKSTMLCHFGNIAWRAGHTINYDAKSGKLVGDREAANLWRREYREGWEPKV